MGCNWVFKGLISKLETKKNVNEQTERQGLNRQAPILQNSRKKILIKRVFLISTPDVNTCFIHFLFIQVIGIHFIKSGNIPMKEETYV